MSIQYNGKNIHLAKVLRKNMTKEEKHLWYDFLRSYPIRFQRQKAIDNYIVDFYCHKAKLIIELDGSQHYDEVENKKDVKRTMILEEKGMIVLRYTNLQIHREFEGVCKQIDQIVKERMKK